MSTGRLEAFSDGVIAVAITLLALGLTVPVPGAHGVSLARNLGTQWPVYLAYVISFATIGIIWINHHAAVRRLREADHLVLVLNLLLLMSVCVLPFSTSLMSTYLTRGDGERLAAVIYSGSLLAMGVCFSFLNAYMLIVAPRLLDDGWAADARRRLLRRSVSGLLPYAVAVVVAPFSPVASVIICGLVALLYALPGANTLPS